MKDSGSQLARRLSVSSNKSFHSIDEFRNTSNPFEQQSRKNSFPLRPAINILLILLTTLQVFIVVNSRIYLRSQLVRTFLSVYIDQDPYPQLFNGQSFYLTVTNITELQIHFKYLFERVNTIDDDSFVDFYYKDAKFYLHTEYKQIKGNQHRQNVHQINSEQGILKPFNMSNVTDIQLYLLQIQSFELQIVNLTMKQNWYGFQQKYSHSLKYYFIDSIRLQINFNFKINNAMVSSKDDKDQQQLNLVNCIDGDCYYHLNKVSNYQRQNDDDEHKYQLIYILRIRIFFGAVLVLSIMSLYLNYVSIRRTFQFVSQELNKNRQLQQQPENEPDHYHHPLIGQQQEHKMIQNIRKWVQINNMTITDMKFQHYFDLLEFDLIFSTLSNIFAIITALYLVAGFERERIAGVTCLFSWMTIFKFIRNYQKLVLMYQLIKLSFGKVIKFFVQFFPVFLSYTLLGVCLFPKVSFFCSMSNAVTTLVGIMMGDSIQMITNAILQKNSTVLGILYIFSFVFLFMHAIHNTLTSLIKQFFILKKIQLVLKQKQKNGDQNYVYIDQLKIKAEQQKQKLPLKLSGGLMKGLLRVRALKRTNKFKQIITFLFHQIEQIKLTQKWIIQEDQLSRFARVKEQLIRRSIKINQLLTNFNANDKYDKYSMISKSTILEDSSIIQRPIYQSLVQGKDKQSVLTDN